MKDAFGRRVEYLRISVTDRCNLRCVYCMPRQGLPWLPREALLTYEEIQEIVGVMADMGLKRVRLTGGEPLARKDLTHLVEFLSSVRGIDDVALSTNGVLLGGLAVPLRDAGLSRVNVSLDSLRPEKVDELTRRTGTLGRVMEGLEVAEDAGFHPIKVNVVLLRGTNDDEIEDFARLTLRRPWHVRFIELMPTGSNLELSAGSFFSCEETLERLRALGGLEPVPGPPGNGPARYFRFSGARGTVGVISPMSHAFCKTCNRMRLTADGQLRPCLFGSLQTNLRDPLRMGEEMAPLVRETLRKKPESHQLVRGSDRGSGGLIALSQTGG